MDSKSAGKRLTEFSQGFFRALDLIYVHEKATTPSGTPFVRSGWMGSKYRWASGLWISFSTGVRC
jgi:hypothetical protein